jgi:hypothetical protein
MSFAFFGFFFFILIFFPCRRVLSAKEVKKISITFQAALSDNLCFCMQNELFVISLNPVFHEVFLKATPIFC